MGNLLGHKYSATQKTVSQQYALVCRRRRVAYPLVLLLAVSVCPRFLLHLPSQPVTPVFRLDSPGCCWTGVLGVDRSSKWEDLTRHRGVERRTRGVMAASPCRQSGAAGGQPTQSSATWHRTVCTPCSQGMVMTPNGQVLFIYLRPRLTIEVHAAVIPHMLGAE